MEERLFKQTIGSIKRNCVDFFSNQSIYALESPVIVYDSLSRTEILIQREHKKKTPHYRITITSLDQNADWCKVQFVDNHPFLSCSNMFLAFMGIIAYLFWLIFVETASVSTLAYSVMYSHSNTLLLRSLAIPFLLFLISTVISISFIVSNNIHKRFVREFWCSLGWQQIQGQINRGNLISERTSHFDTVMNLIKLSVMLFGLLLFGIPQYLIVLLIFNEIPENLTKVWCLLSVPYIQWKLELIDGLPMRIAKLGFISLFALNSLTFLAIGTISSIDMISSINSTSDVLEMSDYYDQFFSKFHFEANTITDLLSFYSHEDYETVNRYGNDLSEIGPFIFDWIQDLTGVTNNQSSGRMLGIVIISSFSILVLVIWLSNWKDLFMVSKNWQEKYNSLFRASDNLLGIRSSITTWWQDGLFNSWVIIRWTIAILINIFAILSIATALGCDFENIGISGLNSLVIPLSLMNSSLEVVFPNHAVILNSLFLSLLTLPYVFSVMYLIIATGIVCIKSWLDVRGNKLNTDDIKYWEKFLDKYSLPKVDVMVTNRTYELYAQRILFRKVIVIPSYLWKEFRENKYLSNEQIEFLFLHEIGHLQDLKMFPFCGVIGVITLVGSGYWGLLRNTIKYELNADKFAITAIEKKNSGLNKSNLIKSAISNYSRSAILVKCSPIIGKKRLKQNLPHMENIYYWGQKELGYIHPDLNLRSKICEDGYNVKNNGFFSFCIILLISVPSILYILYSLFQSFPH